MKACERHLFNALADPARRLEATSALARHWKVDAILVLIRDHELGVLRPAPGFRQTLPGGPSWRDLFGRCTGAGRFTGLVAFPDATSLSAFSAQVDDDGSAVLVLLGDGADRSDHPDLADIGFPLLAGLLRAESQVVASLGSTASANGALAQAESLTAALGRARSDLACALTDADRLNSALGELNITLEQRVAERTRQLKAEMAERQKAEEQLRQAQKMEAVGQLTGGLAHDFNNLLTSISGSLELLQTRIAQGRVEDVDRYVGAAQGAARRAAALTQRLLAFSRRQTLDPKATDVNRLVGGMDDLVRRTMGPEIAVEFVAAGGLWNTLIDPSQLENALLNLCINARDAMVGGGTLTVETGNCPLDARAAVERELPPGQYVTLCVSDDGIGMSPEIVDRVFEPFFTTKPLGQGTGLGLSMIYGFVRQSGGQIRVHSAPGRGTTVRLYLPRHRGDVHEPDGLAALADAPRAENDEMVLVVDDEPIVRMLVAEVLADLGYVALEAADGAAGLKVLLSDARIDLLVTDVGLPGGMNGRQMADAARVARPDLKVLFITGYAEHAVLSHGHLEPGMHVLTKPFAMEALASRIKDLTVSG